jgi:hypothetical protein
VALSYQGVLSIIMICASYRIFAYSRIVVGIVATCVYRRATILPVGRRFLIGVLFVLIWYAGANRMFTYGRIVVGS